MTDHWEVNPASLPAFTRFNDYRTTLVLSLVDFLITKKGLHISEAVKPSALALLVEQALHIYVGDREKMLDQIAEGLVILRNEEFLDDQGYPTHKLGQRYVMANKPQTTNSA